jgi:hypothetical protein
MSKGLSDNQISKRLKIGRNYVGQLRLEAGIKRPNYRKWTQEKVIEFAKRWYQEFGVLSANDWNVGYLRATGDKVRLKRFYGHDAPHLNTVLQLFGSWSEMKRQAGIPASKLGQWARNPKPKRQ